jgi:hypothetical protein
MQKRISGGQFYSGGEERFQEAFFWGMPMCYTTTRILHQQTDKEEGAPRVRLSVCDGQ